MAWTPLAYEWIRRSARRAVLPSLVMACALGGTVFAKQNALTSDEPTDAGAITLRVACLHLPGVRTKELAHEPADVPRLRELARTIQGVRPNILVLSGLDYDTPDAPDSPADGEPGRNAKRFADRYLATPQGEGLAGLRFDTYMPMTNSGQPSGMDLDRSGTIETTWIEPANPSVPTGEESAARARYSGDCWGPGFYPGQRGLAILVDSRLTIDRAHIRTIRLMPWDYVPASSMPGAEPGSTPWYTPEQQKAVRVCSGVMVDVPVALPNRAVVHLITSTPIELGGADEGQRRARRHRDEIRLVADYAEGQGYLVDDAGQGGGLEAGASFVILGNLGAAPGDERAYRDPIKLNLFTSPRVNARVTPMWDEPGAAAARTKQGKADTKSEPSRGSKSTDPRSTTTREGRREDYVLPSTDLGIRAAGVWRAGREDGRTDERKGAQGAHDPVWMDLWVRPPASAPR